MTEPTNTELIALRFVRALRIAVVAVTAAVLLGWQLPTVVEYASRYRPAWVEFGAVIMLAVVTLLAAVIVVRDRPWGRLRWPVLAIVVACCVIATAGVASADQGGPPHWSWQTFGWFAVILLMDLPIMWFAAVWLAYLGLTLIQVLLNGQHDARVLVGMGTATLVLGGWQFAVAQAAVTLRRSAVTANRIAEEEEALRTAELVAEQVHRDRQSRYADLAQSAVPLLAGLAGGELDPGDPLVRRAAMIEAARLRRLFAESDDVLDPLEHELLACIEVAERRGVAVQFAVCGMRPQLPRAARRALTEPVIAVLAGAVATARVTVVAVQQRVVVSVVADRAPGVLPAGRPSPGLPAELSEAELSEVELSEAELSEVELSEVAVSWLTGGDAIWLDATWLDTTGLDTTGLDTTGLDTTGLDTDEETEQAS